MKMTNKYLAVCVVALLLLMGGAAYADWTASYLKADSGDQLKLTPACTAVAGGFAYTYDLENLTPKDNIVGFTLVLPWVVNVNDLTNIVVPADWRASVTRDEIGGVQENLIHWRALTDQAAIVPTAMKTFGFTSIFGPSAQEAAEASSLDSQGYSGDTFGPVPEPATVMSLIAGIAGLVSLRRRRS